MYRLAGTPWHRNPVRTLVVLIATGLASAVFLAHAIASVIGPTSLARAISQRVQRIRAGFITEDILLRALELGEIESGGVVEVEEGELSPFPNRLTKVELRYVAGEPRLLCRLRRGRQQLFFLANYSRGVLPPALSWALGVGDSSSLDDAGVVVRGESGTLTNDARQPNVHPFRIPGAWSIPEDLLVRASSFLDSELEAQKINLANFRLAPELPLAALAEPTDLDDFALGRAQGRSLVADFRTNRDLVVRVSGHLWLGTPDRTLLVGTGGKNVLILVTGNVYVKGSIRMLGPYDRMMLVAGRPEWPAYRDANANGRRDEGEGTIPASAPAAPLGPREGGGLIYLGDADEKLQVQAWLIANHDLIVGQAGATVQGSILLGGGIVRPGSTPAPLTIRAETRFKDRDLPRRGLPVLPGTERRQHISNVRLVSTVTPRERS